MNANGSVATKTNTASRPNGSPPRTPREILAYFRSLGVPSLHEAALCAVVTAHPSRWSCPTIGAAWAWPERHNRRTLPALLDEIERRTADLLAEWRTRPSKAGKRGAR